MVNSLQYNLYTREKCFCKTLFQLGMDRKKDRDTAEMKERRKTTRYLQKYTADIGYYPMSAVYFCFLSSLSCFRPLFRSITNRNKVSQKLFSTVSVVFRGFSKPPSKQEMTSRLCWRRTLLAWGTNAFCASNQCFSTGDKRTENARSNFILTHTQRLSNKSTLEVIATDRYSPPKTSGSYHALVLNFEYAIPTSYICNSVLCWTTVLGLKIRHPSCSKYFVI